MFSKEGTLESETYLDFVRALPCCLCHGNPPSQAHHFPPKGRGVVRDDKTMPVCIGDHQRCHGIPVVENGTKHPPIGEKRQGELVAITRLKFMEHATTAQWEAFARDRARWIESRGGKPAEVPW